MYSNREMLHKLATAGIPVRVFSVSYSCYKKGASTEAPFIA